MPADSEKVLDPATNALMRRFQAIGLGKTNDVVSIALAVVRGIDPEQLGRHDTPTSNEWPLVMKIIVGTLKAMSKSAVT